MDALGRWPCRRSAAPPSCSAARGRSRRPGVKCPSAAAPCVAPKPSSPRSPSSRRRRSTSSCKPSRVSWRSRPAARAPRLYYSCTAAPRTQPVPAAAHAPPLRWVRPRAIGTAPRWRGGRLGVDGALVTPWGARRKRRLRRRLRRAPASALPLPRDARQGARPTPTLKIPVTPASARRSTDPYPNHNPHPNPNPDPDRNPDPGKASTPSPTRAARCSAARCPAGWCCRRTARASGWWTSRWSMPTSVAWQESPPRPRMRAAAHPSPAAPSQGSSGAAAASAAPRAGAPHLMSTYPRGMLPRPGRAVQPRAARAWAYLRVALAAGAPPTLPALLAAYAGCRS